MVILCVEGGIFFGLAVGLFSFIFNQGHFLSSLLSLEYLVLVIYWGMSAVIFSLDGDFFFSLFYLTAAVCEGVLGLSLLISCTQSHGSDLLKMYNNLNC
uniref:NADH dehydrogenase subunit 4L n=1 Tax=Macrohectopus branickii TaxID=65455 RepID=UPI002AA2B3FD|nr:NADH dehydrogenase subunit 4L [Macrohectopus branickii]WPS63577.1 NADH dehydrogenase subunit 4l [Macrohectopus branickii]